MKNSTTNQLPSLAKSVALADPSNDLNGYLRLIRSLPLLSAEEEIALARRYHEHQDLRAAEQLVLFNLRYVIPIVRSYKGYGLPEADLLQEGSIGLMKAVKRFDVGAGVRLMTFASHWIRAEINEYILKNWRMVKIATTKAQRKLFFKLRSHKSSLEAINHTQALRIANELGVKPEEVLAMDARLSLPDVSVATPQENEDDDQPILTLSDDRYIPETMAIEAETERLTQQRVQDALSTLNEREQAIIEARLLREDKMTLAELAETFGISLERVRQIETAALKKLKNHLSVLIA
ncbi:MAG: RNA polymerase sigma factor RpoH [Thiotrichales bacterium]|jgi:RNA polymerase sigma-32 factor|nr:RNA polymerase sigma factor RpoH [Thiotrichales bacterium]